MYHALYLLLYFQAKSEGLYAMSCPVTSVGCSSLCLQPQELASSDFLLEEEGEGQNDQRWPVEVMVMVHEEGSITVLNRFVQFSVM